MGWTGSARRRMRVATCWRASSRPWCCPDGGALGRVYAVDLVFHNAYGPDKAWFYDPALSGGGCVMDLGVHLVDLALWALDFPEPATIASTLLAGGAPLQAGQVEDYAVAQIA